MVMNSGIMFLRVFAGFLAGLVIGVLIMRRTVKKMASPPTEQEAEQSHAAAGSHL